MGSLVPGEMWRVEDARAWLVGLQPRGIQLGLDRVREALARLGHPERRLRVATVAGTNGKGSTASFLASIVHTAGYRVGLYTSPHLLCMTERIRVGGTAILPGELAAWAARVRAVVEGLDGGPPVPLTFFEAMTVLAVGYFAAREVDLAVLEVGMGGRLDATAAVPPEVAVITPIGLDHQAFLGDTLEAIAFEKAGILQPGATLVTNVAPELFRDVVGPRAFELRCPIRRAGVDWQWRWLHRGFRYRGWHCRVGPVRLGLLGTHQGENAALACAAAEELRTRGFRLKAVHLAEGLQRTRHPGRLERREPTRDAAGRLWPAMILDGAHNPHAAGVLARQLDAHLPEHPRVMLFSARPDKDVAGILGPVAPHLDALVVTTLADTPPPDFDAIAPLAHRYGLRLEVEPHVPSALDAAIRRAGPRGGVLVAGSLYLLGEVLPLIPQRPAVYAEAAERA